MEDNEVFRDSIGTVTVEGKRAWVYPSKPRGLFYRYRKYVSYFLLTILFVSPFLKINGNQFILLNVLERKFNIFGFSFWPQDFYIFVLFMVTSVVFISLFTVAFGRVFCGWICPQTIFMEMVFRRIEYWIEGDRGKQKRLGRMPWNAEKIRKKLTKWSVFFVISFLISNVFLAYLTGSDSLITMIIEGPSSHLGTLISLIIFTFVFYFVFAWFREQVCVIACPYGRLQGVLLDDKSIVVAYDHKRGEAEKGRKKIRKNEDRSSLGYGDCIDCHQCVNVCPTGIDIRNGTQLECVNCTACIDECDNIMEKVKLPKGLIRYASVENIEEQLAFKLSSRFKAYLVVLAILVGVLSTIIFLRTDIELTLVRLPGQLPIIKEQTISNVYTYKVINKTNESIQNVSFGLINLEGTVEIVGNKTPSIPKQGFSEGTLFIEIDKSKLKPGMNDVKLGVFGDGKLIEFSKEKFMGRRTFR